MCEPRNAAAPTALVGVVAGLGLATAIGLGHLPFSASATAQPTAAQQVAQAQTEAQIQNARLSVQQHQIQVQQQQAHLQEVQANAAWSERMTAVKTVAIMVGILAATLAALGAALMLVWKARQRWTRPVVQRRPPQRAIVAAAIPPIALPAPARVTPDWGEPDAAPVHARHPGDSPL